MKNIFDVEITEFTNLREIPGVWLTNDYSAILDSLDYGDQSDLSEADTQEVCLMSLQDLKPETAAEVVLNHKMSNVLKPGQIKNISTEMLEEKLWEEYADLSLQESFFNIGSLLYAAFPSEFPKPDAAYISISVTPTNDQAIKALDGKINESFLVRLLADGMGSGAVLHRMFDEQLAGKKFPEAESIIWIINEVASEGSSKKLQIVSSGYWLDPLEHVNTFESGAYSDIALTTSSTR